MEDSGIRQVEFTIRERRNATRCDICHQHDQFDAVQDFCGRCAPVVARFRGDNNIAIRQGQIRFLVAIVAILAMIIGPLVVQLTYLSIVLGKAIFSGSYEIAAFFFVPWLCTLVFSAILGTPLYITASALYGMRGD